MDSKTELEAFARDLPTVAQTVATMRDRAKRAAEIEIYQGRERRGSMAHRKAAADAAGLEDVHRYWSAFVRLHPELADQPVGSPKRCRHHGACMTTEAAGYFVEPEAQAAPPPSYYEPKERDDGYDESDDGLPF